MSFGKREPVSRQMQVLTALETVGSGSEDEETKRWEEEQMTKGVKAAMEPQNVHPPQNTLTALDQSFMYGSTAYPSDPTVYSLVQPPTLPPSAPYQEPYSTRTTQPHIPNRLIPVTVESLKCRLQRHLQELEESHSGHRQRLDQLDTDLETAHREIVRREQRSSEAALEYQFFQEMRGYIRDILSCLTEKVSWETWLTPIPSCVAHTNFKPWWKVWY